MTKILFICHGNICRSVAAHYIMQHLVHEAGYDDLFEIDSAAATREELGNPIYPPMRKVLEENGIPIGNHRARLITAEDYDRFDMLIGMDYENLRDMNNAYGESGDHRIGYSSFRFEGRVKTDDPEDKLSLLLDHAENTDGEISDPWYTRDFDLARREIEAGCRGLLSKLTAQEA